MWSKNTGVCYRERGRAGAEWRVCYHQSNAGHNWNCNSGWKWPSVLSSAQCAYTVKHFNISTGWEVVLTSSISFVQSMTIYHMLDLVWALHCCLWQPVREVSTTRWRTVSCMLLLSQCAQQATKHNSQQWHGWIKTRHTKSLNLIWSLQYATSLTQIHDVSNSLCICNEENRCIPQPHAHCCTVVTDIS